MQTDNQQPTKTENGNSKLDAAQTAPPISDSGSRASANSPYLTPRQLQFLLRVAPPALDGQRVYEIPACVTVAQAILESATPQFGWGSSSLFRLANNPFGIKYSHFFAARTSLTARPVEKAQKVEVVEKAEAAGPLTSLTSSTSSTLSTSAEDYGHFDAETWEIVNGQKKVMIAQFQRFPNLTEAFIAHAHLLRAPRYRPAFAVRHDWKQFAKRLGPKSSPLDSEHCGYSTNPSYSAEIIKLVLMYRLDDPRALEWFATGKDPGHQVSGLPDHPAVEPSLRSASIGA
jgi:flagellum-specific peptidoglycan hydrolase FlgJ